MNELSSLSCLLMPLQDQALLLANDNVAEVVLAKALDLSRGSDVIQGWLAWRGRDIPVLSFEALRDDQAATANRLACIAVLHGIHKPDQLPFYGIALSAAPRVLKLTASDLAETGTEAAAYCRSQVSLQQTTLSIPDLDAVEAALWAALQS